MRRAAELPIAVVVVVLLTVFVTWPQALVMTSMVAAHDDPQFSMWRIGWIAHALSTNPLHLFDGNIFYPARNTLTFSDATLLEGVIATPFLLAKVPPVLLYNLMLLAGFAGSGIAMFVLVRHLTGELAPALVSAAMFTMAPYRIEHFMHLELQWAMWIPLAFWAFHRAVDEGSRKFGVLGGVFLWLQIVSCVYYGVFLAITLVLLVPLIMALNPRGALKALPGIMLGALVAALLTAPYALPYLATARTLGPRDTAEILTYSARPLSYFVSPPQNRLWGWTASRWGGPEVNLFPGIITVALAVCALVWRRPRLIVFVYAFLAAILVELSFGPRGRLYGWLAAHMELLQGLRSPSRFAVVGCAATAVLAGFGFRAIQERFATGRVRAIVLALAVLGLVALDFSNRAMILKPQSDVSQSPVYRVVRSAGPGVVVDLPLPTAGGLPGREAEYALWSTAHWHPLVNGYSGYYTPEYIETLGRMEQFPDDRSIAQLKALNVRYLVVHRAFYKADQYTSLLLRIGARPELRSYGEFDDPVGDASLFVLETGP